MVLSHSILIAGLHTRIFGSRPPAHTRLHALTRLHTGCNAAPGSASGYTRFMDHIATARHKVFCTLQRVSGCRLCPLAYHAVMVLWFSNSSCSWFGYWFSRLVCFLMPLAAHTSPLVPLWVVAHTRAFRARALTHSALYGLPRTRAPRGSCGFAHISHHTFRQHARALSLIL